MVVGSHLVVDIDFRSQLKSPNKIMLDVLSQAFSKGDIIRLKNILSISGLYITENKTEQVRNLTSSHISLKAINKQVFPMHSK